MLLSRTPLYNALSKVAPGNVNIAAPLNQLSYWKIGGNADYMVEPSSIEELANVRKILSQFPDIPNMIIGDTSNLLFDDRGFQGTIVKIGNKLSSVRFSGDRVFCEAGVWVPGLAFQSYRKKLSGLEHTCGIPGRLGGLIYMNGGSNRQSISENLESVVLIDSDGSISTHSTLDLGFSYRESPFQTNNKIIAAATLKLKPADRATVRNSMRKTLASRRRKFPRKMPNCGSVFVSNPKMYDLVGPPGFAIEQVGLKGVRQGNAQISHLHANFIVNLGGASSNDVLYLISQARQKVHASTDFWMDCEARYVSPDGKMCKAHEKADELYR